MRIQKDINIKLQKMMKSSFLTTVPYSILVGPFLDINAWLRVFPMLNNCTSRQISGLGQFVERLGKGHSLRRWLNRSMVPPMHLLRFEASHHELDGRIEFLGLKHGGRGGQVPMVV